MRRLSDLLAQSSITASDYQEIRMALVGMGKTREQIPLIYLVACWLLPVLVSLVSFLVFGMVGGVIHCP